MRKKTGAIDLTTGNEMGAIVVFALPLIAGNLFQQLYNLMDTMIVGKLSVQMRWPQSVLRI